MGKNIRRVKWVWWCGERLEVVGSLPLLGRNSAEPTLKLVSGRLLEINVTGGVMLEEVTAKTL